MNPAQLSGVLRNRRRDIILGVISLLGFSMARQSLAAPWSPEQTTQFIVAAGPGGALDGVARSTKQFIDQKGDAKSPVLVLNKPGANGKIAFDILKQNQGNPYYLSINTHGYISSYLIGSLDILPNRDLTTVAVLQDEYLTLAVRADSPIKDIGDVVTALKKDPTSLRIAVATSIGNHIHIGTAKALKAAGVDIRKLVVVPFRSSSDSIVALIGGQLELVASTTPNVISMLRAGKIRLLAVSSNKRLGGDFVNVPTWRESGIDSVFSSALGILAPKNISQEQILYWENIFEQMVLSKQWERLMELNQSRSNFMRHKEATAYYDQEYNSVRSIVSELGLLAPGK
jgi:putative tricarboxylic transport membrane protein